jgi:hypothetical protein
MQICRSVALVSFRIVVAAPPAARENAIGGSGSRLGAHSVVLLVERAIKRKRSGACCADIYGGRPSPRLPIVSHHAHEGKLDDGRV